MPEKENACFLFEDSDNLKVDLYRQNLSELMS